MNPQTLEKLNTSAELDSYSPELEAQDPFFNRATQRELDIRMATPESEFVEYDPRAKRQQR